MADELKIKANAFKSDLRPIWCPGCGDFGVLAAAYRAFAELDLDPDRTVVVSGIGCSSRFPCFVTTYGFHGVHGRALPTAMGVKLANSFGAHVVVFTTSPDKVADAKKLGANERIE